MSHDDRLTRDLDRIASRSSDALQGAAAHGAFGRGVARALPLVVVVPLLYAMLEAARWSAGAVPRFLPLAVVALLAAGAPLASGWLSARAARSRSVSRGRALGAADEQLELEGRLLAADEFLGRAGRTGFEQAAVDDAAERSAAAAEAELRARREAIDLRREATLWGGAGVLALALAAWVGTFEPRPPVSGADDATTASRAGTRLADEADEDRIGSDDVAQPAAPRPEPTARRSDDVAKSRQAETAPDASDEVKDSAGKTGAGRSAGALSSSAASESRSAPSTQGQTSKPPERQPKAAERKERKKKDDIEQPTPERRPEDEESGATAGKGSSKGSNKNPTASDWQSRDQVTESDDQEIEEDEDTDDDEEEQENRGGVQPSLRDRRPPVSRDLQIGFGNRPNPDANGRGGPSEQKKSRGVASLVLGVPIPDRIKGRPGPGPTKITQERIEPQAEEATATDASARTPRTSPLGRLSALDLEPHLRALVRSYFTSRRSAVQ
ncbi:MAG: hypothetical protein AAF957_06690 [Planctomycetota bacterium]